MRCVEDRSCENIRSDIVAGLGQDDHEISNYSPRPLKNAVYTSPQHAEQSLGLTPFDEVILYKDSYTGKFKCFPVRVMEKHHAVWDVLVEDTPRDHALITPITVTYCPLSNSAMIYEGNWRSSGLVFNSTIVLTDQSATYLLLHLLGKKIRNEDSHIADKSEMPENVKRYPVIRSLWKAWKQSEHCENTIVLCGCPSKEYRGSLMYEEYFGSNQILFPIHTASATRLPYQPHTEGIGVFNKQGMGVLFIRNAGPKDISNLIYVQCYLFAWMSHFPLSRIM